MRTIISLITLALFSTQSLASENQANDFKGQEDHFTANKNEYVLLDVLANDQNVTPDMLKAVFGVSNGMASIAGDKIVFIPEDPSVTHAEFYYHLATDSDLSGQDIPVAVDFNTSTENSAPVVKDDVVFALKGATDTLVIDPLKNDYDEDGDTLHINDALSNDGTVTSGDYKIVFTPNDFGFGVDKIHYTVNEAPYMPDSKKGEGTIHIVYTDEVAIPRDDVFNDMPGADEVVVNVLENDLYTSVMGNVKVKVDPYSFKNIEMLTWGDNFESITIVPKYPSSPSSFDYRIVIAGHESGKAHVAINDAEASVNHAPVAKADEITPKVR